jgi:hypothetical protein
MTSLWTVGRRLEKLVLLQYLCIFTPLLLSGLAGAKTAQRLHGEVPPIVSSLTPVDRLADSTPIDLVIGLPLRNGELFARALHDIYDPTSPRFHQYLTPGQYTEIFCPTVASYNALLSFARANKLTVVIASPNRKSLHVRAPAAIINRVFHVTLQQYRHPTENRLFYAPDVEPTLELEEPISSVTGLNDFRLPGRFSHHLYQTRITSTDIKSAGGSGSGGLYTGSDFRAAYAPGVSLTGRGQVVGIIEFTGYTQSDIRAYETQNSLPDVPLQNVYLDGYVGGSPNEESAADIELVISMEPGISEAVIYGAGYNVAGVQDLLNEMANPTKGEPLPYQITTSYYFFYNQNVYDTLSQLAVQGQALFVASGDFGSYNEITGSGAFPPADHPLVTSVGGTELQTTGPGGPWSSETTVSFSGGGYSPWAGGDPQFAFPAWQSGINFTLSQGSTSARNAPDVAMVADNILVYDSGNWQGFAGTSASAPLWAGFMALVNEQAAAGGKPRVGFANPALYAIGKGGNCPSCFHDITTGNNFNSTNPSRYRAVEGYDLCTGWGSPNGKSLINALVEFGTWGTGESLGGNIPSAPFVVTRTNDRMDVFARAADNTLWHTWWDHGIGWGKGESLGGNIASAPFVVTRTNDRMDVFARAADNTLWHTWWDHGIGWGKGESLGGNIASAPFVVTRTNDRMDVFARAADNTLWHTWWDHGIGWGTGESLGGNIVLDAYVVTRGTAHMEVFAIANDRSLWHRGWDQSVGWTDSNSLGGVLGSSPFALTRGTNRIEIFAESTDQMLWHNWGNFLSQ